MGIRECCSTFIASLPDPSLPLLPSFILGTICSAFILLFVYARESRLGIKATVKLALGNLFCFLPRHAEGEACRNPDCVRCHRYHELMAQILFRWPQMKLKDPKLDLQRVEAAVQKLSHKFKSSAEKQDWKEVEYAETNPNKKEKMSVKSTHAEFQKPTLLHMDLPANPYWGDLPVYQREIELLQLNFPVILQEYKSVFGALQNGDHTGWKLNDIEQGHWCVFPLMDQGIIHQANSQRCPNTAAVLASLPSAMTDCVFGNASFSCLYSDSFISPHHGPSNIRLRCHLGLEVPKGCWLEVAGKQHQWEAGRCLLFDDSFLHSASHAPTPPGAPQNNPRAVFMLDLWHPNLTAQEKQALTQLCSPN